MNNPIPQQLLAYVYSPLRVALNNWMPKGYLLAPLVLAACNTTDVASPQTSFNPNSLPVAEITSLPTQTGACAISVWGKIPDRKLVFLIDLEAQSGTVNIRGENRHLPFVSSGGVSNGGLFTLQRFSNHKIDVELDLTKSSYQKVPTGSIYNGAIVKVSTQATQIVIPTVAVLSCSEN